MRLEALGVPKNKLKQFESKDIFTVEDLAKYFPRKYHDFRKITPISEVVDGELIAIVGKITEVKSYPKFVRVKVTDKSGKSLFVTWFHMAFVTKMLMLNHQYIFCGKVQTNPQFGTRGMTNPLFFSQDIERYQRLIPVYSKVQGMSDDFLMSTIQSALAISTHEETVEQEILAKFKLLKLPKALSEIHSPQSDAGLKDAQKRFVFDDLFQYAMQMYDYETQDSTRSPYVMKNFKDVGVFLQTLPFSLTEGQSESLREISRKMQSGLRVNALVQGDVGCGKTIVAILLMVVAASNGFQSALMAPTNVLAKQHYEELTIKLQGTPWKVAYISGETKAKQIKEILKGLAAGDVHMVVGTHAILSKDVHFQQLALTIVDEEHRFGVMQRNQLREKAKLGVHHLNMSATPIPRSLALSMWGDSVDVFTIKSMPKGRKPVRTVLLSDELRCFNGIHQQIVKGHQAYVVCPLIEESESMVDVDSVEQTYEKMKTHFAAHPEVKISMISGKMKAEDIEAEIGKFTRNEVNVLISTTIIEVGVNVPNSTMIVVKNAERFGLAQLHQLRGRVGRGNFESFCVMLSEKKDNPKLHAMVETTDGFKIAEKDLELRGTGDFIGTKQSGQNKYVMLMMSHMEIYLAIKNEVKAIHADPKRLSFYEYLNILDFDEVS